MYNNETGGISWIDLTVENAEDVRDFYGAVIGLDSEAFPMKGYEDFVMTAPNHPDSKVGICHAKGANTGLPAQWLIYFNVEDIDHSLAECLARGGRLVQEKRDAGDYDMCVIADPAGAVAALIARKQG
jgi:uncharacterized protein